MSHPEFHAALLALHHPNLVDLHEQKMLNTGPAAHPLFGFPGYHDPALTPVRGTLSVASRLNCRKFHPRVYVEDPDDGTKAPVAFPYQGDLFLFLRIGSKIKLLNWPVKKSDEDFSEPEPASQKKSMRQRQKLDRRMRIERLYHDDIEVPTIRIADNKLSVPLINNLRSAFPYAQRKQQLKGHRRTAAVQSFQDAISQERTATDVLTSLEQDGVCTMKEARDVFYQSIWDRSIRLDLFSNVVMDSPLRSEITDVFTKYEHLFPACPPHDLRPKRAA